jgi:hypothetical protein
VAAVRMVRRFTGAAYEQRRIDGAPKPCAGLL